MQIAYFTMHFCNNKIPVMGLMVYRIASHIAENLKNGTRKNRKRKSEKYSFFLSFKVYGSVSSHGRGFLEATGNTLLNVEIGGGDQVGNRCL
jgi:hypothetical protein